MYETGTGEFDEIAAKVQSPPSIHTRVMKPVQQPTPNSGSYWYRWEPHVHAPGTVLNDQFKGKDKWETYLAALETATPQIRAIGVTDYYSTDTYVQALEAKRSGRLPNCDLIFPDIEMRLGIGSVKGRWVNVHLLVCPDDPNHLAELKRFLARLSFGAHNDSYAYTKDDLIRLGQRSNPDLTEPTAALEHGQSPGKNTRRRTEVYGFQRVHARRPRRGRIQ
jgi:hypothetical protein